MRAVDLSVNGDDGTVSMFAPKLHRAMAHASARSVPEPYADAKGISRTHRQEIGNQDRQRDLRHQKGATPALSRLRDGHDSAEQQAASRSEEAVCRFDVEQLSSGHANAAASATDGRSPGPLEPAVRAQMEAQFGTSFSEVRVHTSGEAARSAKALQAQAFTLGSDIFFSPGRYAPDSRAGRKLLAHELTHVLQQRSSGRPLIRRSPDEGAPEELDTQQIAQFWASVEAVSVTERARVLAQAAVDQMMKARAPELRQIEQDLDDLKRSGFAEQESHRIRALEARRQEIFDEYDPSKPHSSKAPYAGLFMRLPVSTIMTPLSGPPELTRQTLDPLVDEKYARNIKADKMKSFGKFGGRVWKQPAVRSSVGDAYAYNIESNAYQVADDLERLARAGYTEIHIATGTHGNEYGYLDPEFQFFEEDAFSIKQTMKRHPGLKITPHDMSDPMQAAMFDSLQAQAAEGKLPGGATHAAFCYSRNRVLDPNQNPAGPYASVELLERSGGLAPHVGSGALTAAMGAWSIYSGLDDPSEFWRAAKVTSGGLQVTGGISYALGYATESIGLAKFGSTVGEIGGFAGQAIAWVDIYRQMSRQFDPNAPQMAPEESIELAFQVAGAIFPELAFHALAVHYVVLPVAAKTSEYATPKFIGAMSEAYGIPSQYLWGMH